MIGRYHCSIINHCSIGQSKILCVLKIASVLGEQMSKLLLNSVGVSIFIYFVARGQIMKLIGFV